MNNYVMVTDFIAADGTRDVSDDLQKIIDENPNKPFTFLTELT